MNFPLKFLQRKSLRFHHLIVFSPTLLPFITAKAINLKLIAFVCLLICYQAYRLINHMPFKSLTAKW